MSQRRRPVSLPALSINKSAPLLIAEDIREMFSYDAVEGVLRWRIKPSPRVRLGMVAGSNSGDGYKQIRIRGWNYRLHRVIWLHVKGEWPPHEVDHRDGDRRNNRIDNLRLATRPQNEWNKGARGRAGIKGVWQRVGRKNWYAGIRLNGKTKHIGCFDTAEEAGRAYAAAAALNFGEFSGV